MEYREAQMICYVREKLLKNDKDRWDFHIKFGIKCYAGLAPTAHDSYKAIMEVPNKQDWKIIDGKFTKVNISENC